MRHNLNKTLIACCLCLSLGALLLRAQSSEIAQLPALLQIAAEHPPLGIAGTDPTKLQESITHLVSARVLLAGEQEGLRDAWDVYTSLYPIHFLSAVAHAEQTRVTLLETPSARNARKYRAALHRALYFGERDATRYCTTAVRLAGQSVRTYSFAGLSTTDTLLARCRNILQRMGEVRQKVVNMHDAPPDTKTPDKSRDHLSRPHESTIAAYKKFLRGRSRPTHEFTVELPESACMRELPGPYLFYRVSAPGFPERIHALNELSFSPIGTTTAAHAYLRSHGVENVPYRPLNFYICDEVQNDSGLVYALTDAATAFNLTPHTITQEAIEVAMRSADPAMTQHVQLMLIERSGHLDVLIERIASQMTHLARTHETAIPVDITPRTLFLNYSAFPSVFLAHNAHAGDTPMTTPLSDAKALTQMKSFLVSYEEAVARYGESALFEDAATLLRLDSL